jgi:RimJ/RimL family protein N-acetyltransferase
VELVRWVAADAGALADLLAGEEWPFHAGGRPTREAVLARAAAGDHDNPGTRTYWVVAAGERVGVVRLFDLDDGTPLFDLRLRAAHRGRGLGTAAVRALTALLFGEFPGLTRIEATTRADNAAMARVLERCGYVREARYREAWPVPGGPPLDSLGYAILRREWAPGPTPAPGGP